MPWVPEDRPTRWKMHLANETECKETTYIIYHNARETLERKNRGEGVVWLPNESCRLFEVPEGYWSK